MAITEIVNRHRRCPLLITNERASNVDSLLPPQSSWSVQLGMNVTWLSLLVNEA